MVEVVWSGGVGKTTIARIIARLISCQNKQEYNGEDNENFLIEPCNKCNNCTSFPSHPDIIEMDAASNTGVDDVRVIIDNCSYRPVISKYKFFIIDEVHMLSKNAFNALLKILEEPPEYVIFIFATTEINKIPITIISRCQRHNLKRFSIDDIKELINNIADKENITVSKSALNQIALNSGGSARDALCLLDQATSFALYNVDDYNDSSPENKISISLDIIDRMLGMVSISTIVDLVQFILQNKIENALTLINNIYTDVTDIKSFLCQISNFIGYLVKQKIFAIENINNSIVISEEYSGLSINIKEIISSNTINSLTNIYQIVDQESKNIITDFNILDLEMLVIKMSYAVKIYDFDYFSDKNQNENSNTSTNIQFLNSSKTQENQEKHNQNSYLELESFNIFMDFLKDARNNRKLNIVYFILNDSSINFSNIDEYKIEFFLKDIDDVNINKVRKEFNNYIKTRFLDEEMSVKLLFTLQENNIDNFLSFKKQMVNKDEILSIGKLLRTKIPDCNIEKISLTDILLS
ncbi:MAG TPA: DNA polymerase III subunit gamma/tau [Candidatus Megaira endosymbiont of Hartmannula sinica]|nr:DNA polymerase III subunit gamma/tau [Candidatus Megaera endosymbiont of Hartmannula sinica]